MAEVDVIGIRVVEPQSSGKAILAGTVSRDDLKGVAGHQSPAMILKLLGIDEETGEKGLHVSDATLKVPLSRRHVE